MDSVVFDLHAGSLSAALAALFLSYITSLVIYRLYFSPIAKFPGSKLAAATYLYELYYDLWKRGKYTWRIRDLHAIYGPIVRISPNELHINDPDYYDKLYSREGRWEKNPFYTNSIGNPVSGFGTVDHDLHRLRRGAINRFFSKQKVAALQPLIQQLADKLCDKLEKHQGTGEPVPIELGFDAFTMDVISEYCLDKNLGYLDVPGWSGDFRELERGFIEMAYMQKLFPPLISIMESLPDRLVTILNPRIQLLLDFFRTCYRIAQDMLADPEADAKYQEKEHPTIFYEIIHSPDLPPFEKTAKRLEREAAAVLGAGAVTTAWVLTVALYHLSTKPENFERLRKEVSESISPDGADSGTLPKLNQLEQLPYLTAVIMESLRIGNGVCTRLARVAPDRSIFFDHWEIPKGTPVGMTSTLLHQNPEVFKQPLEFIPERWLDPKEKQRLERYLVPFSRGTRQCAGINLAWAELYIMLGTICKRINLELFETTRDDVDMHSDMLIPEPKNYANGVRFLIL